jgi:hypothetical protein
MAHKGIQPAGASRLSTGEIAETLGISGPAANRLDSLEVTSGLEIPLRRLTVYRRPVNASRR